MMIVTELFPVLQDLPKIDKLRVVQFLISELAKDEESNLLLEDHSYPVWSPYDAPEAANVLLNALKEDNG